MSPWSKAFWASGDDVETGRWCAPRAKGRHSEAAAGAAGSTTRGPSQLHRRKANKTPTDTPRRDIRLSLQMRLTQVVLEIIQRHDALSPERGLGRRGARPSPVRSAARSRAPKISRAARRPAVRGNE